MGSPQSGYVPSGWHRRICVARLLLSPLRTAVEETEMKTGRTPVPVKRGGRNSLSAPPSTWLGRRDLDLQATLQRVSDVRRKKGCETHLKEAR